MDEAGSSPYSEITQNGLLLQHSLHRTGSPIMLPPIPKSKFPDKFPENTSKKAELKEIDKQRQYEAEVRVYRALERMKGDFIVIHSFEYSQQQHGLFVSDTPQEGQSDFLVIGKNSVAVLEVKAPSFGEEHRRNNVFKRNHHDSKTQRSKTVKLIDGICEKIGLTGEHFSVLQFTVFCDIERSSACVLPYYTNLDDTERSRILFKEDLHSSLTPVSSLDRVTSQYDAESPTFKALETNILGIWSTGSKEFSCSDLRNAIEHVDQLLSRSTITRRPAGPPSSLVKGGPKAFKEHLDMDCLTVDQKSIFNDKRTKLWINGPASTGKTILIAGKVIEMAKKPDLDRKIVVFAMKPESAIQYRRYFNNAGVKNRLFCNSFAIKEESTSSASTLEKVDIIYFRKTPSGQTDLRSSFINCLSAVLSSKDQHIFLDDFHAFTFLGGTSTSPTQGFYDSLNLLLSEFHSKYSRTLWVTFDAFQAKFFLPSQASNSHSNGTFKKISAFENIPVVVLHANLRNTYEIAMLLASTLDSRKTMSSEFEFGVSFQTGYHAPGHFIHGPVPNLCITSFGKLERDDLKTGLNKDIRKILDEQLAKVGEVDTCVVVLKDNPIDDHVLHYQYHDWEDPSQYRSRPDVSVHYYEETFSMEWPAVIIIMDLCSVMDLQSPDIFLRLLTRIYIGVSRAKCYLSIIVNLPDPFRLQAQVNDLFGVEGNLNDSETHTTGIDASPFEREVLKLLKVFVGHVHVKIFQRDELKEIMETEKESSEEDFFSSEEGFFSSKEDFFRLYRLGDIEQ